MRSLLIPLCVLGVLSPQVSVKMHHQWRRCWGKMKGHTKIILLGKGWPDGLGNCPSTLTVNMITKLGGSYWSKRVRGGIKMKKIPFHWIKITGSIYSFTFSSLLWNFECVASILKIHWQGKNTFYTSFAVTYHYCDTYNIYTN